MRSSFDARATSCSVADDDAQGVGADATTGSLTLSSTRTGRSEEHTSELQSLMRISYAVFCLKKKKSRNKVPKRYNTIMRLLEHNKQKTVISIKRHNVYI